MSAAGWVVVVVLMLDAVVAVRTVGRERPAASRLVVAAVVAFDVFAVVTVLRLGGVL